MTPRPLFESKPEPCRPVPGKPNDTPGPPCGLGPRGVALIALCAVLASCAPDREPAEPVGEADEVQQVRVVGLDYTFVVPSSIPSGPVRIEFVNQGEVRHEMILVRLRPEVSFSEMMGGMQAGGSPRDFMDGFGGILIAWPGETTWGDLRVDLEPGRTYALVCNLTDSEDSPPHTALGMAQSFTVTDNGDA